MSDQEVPQNDLPEDVSGQQVPIADLSGQSVPESDLPSEEPQSASSNIGQSVLTGIQSAGNFFGLGPKLATAMRNGAQDIGIPQEYLNRVAPTPETMQQMAIENPASAIIGNVIGTAAEFSALPEFVAAPKGAGVAAKLGAKALDLGIKNGLIQGGDDLSKSMLNGDPTLAVGAHTAAKGFAKGFLTGAAAAPVALGMETVGSKLANKIGDKIASRVAGFGFKATYQPEEVVSLEDSTLLPEEKSAYDPAEFEKGQKMYDAMHGKLAKGLATGAGGAIGAKVGGPVGATIGAIAGPYFEDMVEPYVGKAAAKTIGPMIMRASASGNINSLGNILDYGVSTAQGSRFIQKGVDGLFAGSLNDVLKSPSEKDRDFVKDYMDKNGLDSQLQQTSNQQNFAQGGEVAESPMPIQNGLANAFPDHNILLNAIKGRVFNYLKSKRPQENISKLPYDKHRPNPKQEKDYDKLIDMANQPLSILKKVKEGSLTPQNVNDFQQMYPELHQVLAKKIMEKVADHASKEERAPYHLRQSLSLFLGTNLDSTLSPQSMMAAQATFQMNPTPSSQQNTPKPKAKHSTNGLNKLAQNAMTGNQAVAERSVKS